MKAGIFKEYVLQAGLPLTAWDETTPVPAKRGLEVGITGVLQHEGRELKIMVAAHRDFPQQKPDFFLLNAKEFGLLPHLDADGYICYTHDDSIVMDIDNPAGIIKECFVLALQTVKDGLSGDNWTDILDEYEAYWRQLKGVQTMFANIPITDEVGLIKYSRLKQSKGIFAAGDDAELLNSYERFFDSSENPLQYINGLYIPITAGPDFFVPEPGQEIIKEQVQELIWSNLSTENKAKLEKALLKTRTEDLAVLCLRRPDGVDSLFGVHFKNINHQRHPLLPSGAKASIIPLSVQRLDARYLLARGGTGIQFLEKNILVVGAGSVGSAICDELVNAAMLGLTVVDKDNLLAENCYRHRCGFKYVGKPKAEAVRIKLESFYPHARVRAVNLPVMEAIEKKKVNLKIYDAVVVATGNATLNQSLMRVFREEIPGKPVIFAWLDPLGIGGHCLATNITPKGCYQCLYANDDLHNNASFANARQPRSFSKRITGCGSAYVPYGSLDAGQTAIVAIRKLIDIFLGKVRESELVSWKGCSELFTDEGYRLADRYEFSVEELHARRKLFCQPNCSLCGQN